MMGKEKTHTNKLFLKTNARVFKYIEFSLIRFQVKYHYESYLPLKECPIFRRELDSEGWNGRILLGIDKSLLLLLDK